LARLRPLRFDLLACATLAAYCAYLLRKTLLQGGAMVGYDLYTYFYPAKTFAAAALRRGELPLWNPYVFFGAPFLANVQMAVLYPPDALFYVLDFPRAVALSQWLHLCVAAAGMYALARAGWGLDRTAAVVGALAFAGSGFFAAHMGHLNQVHAAAWLPWLALCALRLAAALGRRARRSAVAWLVGGGAVVALMITAGHTQEAYYSLFAIGALAAGFVVLPPARAPVRWAHPAAFAAIAANGALLAAAQLLPALELSRLSYRQGGIPLDEAVAYSVERMNILETLLPTFWTLPSQEVTGYVGVVALPLAAAALAASGARRQVIGLAALALLAVTLALGVYTPLYARLYRWVPLFDSFRAPGRWLLVACFGLAGLAAHGAHAVRWSPHYARRERTALALGIALAAAAGLLFLFIWRTERVHAIQWVPHARVAALWSLAALVSVALALLAVFSRRAWPRVLLAGALAGELAFAARLMEYNQPESPAVYAAEPAVAGYLRTQLERARIGAEPFDRVVSVAVEERLDPERFGTAVPDGSGLFKHYASMRQVLKPNLGIVSGLPTIDGYDGGLLPTRDYARFKTLLVTAEPPVPHLTLPAQAAGKADAALLAALGVRYLLADGRGGPPGPGWVPQASAPGAALVYENAAVGPRAFLVADVRVEPDPDHAAAALAALDLSRAAIVPAAAAPLSGNAAGLAAAAPDVPVANQGARIVRYTAQEVEIETRSPQAALLVLTDAAYPGWRAAVDGVAVPTQPADLLFRSVAVGAGVHRVRFWFDPRSVKVGVAVSALALLGNAAALVRWGRA
jgi:hypothetical protein